MKTVFAEILGRHTAEVIQRASGLVPRAVEVRRQPQSPPSCELAAGIDFQGRLAGTDGPGRAVSGQLMCGFVRQSQAHPILAAMARHLGLDQALADQPDGRINLLKEFLNIVIGLTGAEWAEQGFEMDFSTPADLSGQPPSPPGRDETALHVTVFIDKPEARVDLLAVFRG